MKKYIEMGQTVFELSRSLISPVYYEQDLAESEKPSKKTVLRNNADRVVQPEELIIVSWNILRNYSAMKIRKSLSSILQEYHPHFLLIQEAPVYPNHVFWDEPLFDDFNVYYAPLHQVRKNSSFYPFEHSGQLTLSRFPLSNTAVYELPTVTRPVLSKDHLIQRLALYTQVTLKDNQTLGIYNLHLENATGYNGRKRQLEHLLKIIDHAQDDIVVLGGDFNTIFGSYLEQGINQLEQQGFENVFSSERRFTPRLDYFFIKGAVATGLQLKGKGSDHQPIMAKIRI